MRRRPLVVLLIVPVLALTACAGGEDDPTGADPTEATTTGADGTPVGTPSSPAGSEAAASAASLVIAAVDMGAGTITLRNLGEDPVPLAGYWVCNRPSYHQLPDETIGAGAELEIDVRAIGIAPSGGEVALYDSNAFSSADAIVDYVTWGGADAGRRSVAVEAGIWPDGGTIANDGGAFAATVDAPAGPEDYAPRP